MAKRKKRLPATPRLEDLSEAPYNPREIDEQSLDALKASLQEFGDIAGITWNRRTGHLVAGHQRMRGLRERYGDQLRMSRGVIQCPNGETFRVRVVDWPLKKEKAANVAANNPEIAGWFTDDIVDVLEAVDPGLMDSLRFDELLETLGEKAVRPAAEPEMPDKPKRPRTKKGDIWQMGDHRLLCASSTDAGAIEAFVDGDPVDFIFTSPPYNIGVEYDSHNDEPAGRDEYLAFLRSCIEAWLPHLRGGRFIGWNIAPVARTFHPWQICMMVDEIGLRYFRQIIWKKVGVPMPSWYHTANNLVARNFSPNFIHELVVLLSKGKPSRGGEIEGDPLCEHDVFDLAQSQATVDIPAGRKKTGAKSSLKTRAYKAHPAAYPTRLPGMFMAHFCDQGEIVADPFMGAGSTILAAEQRDRICIGAEIDPGYCDVAVERWQAMTGKKAKRRRS